MRNKRRDKIARIKANAPTMTRAEMMRAENVNSDTVYRWARVYGVRCVDMRARPKRRESDAVHG